MNFKHHQRPVIYFGLHQFCIQMHPTAQLLQAITATMEMGVLIRLPSVVVSLMIASL
jgi:hypothetical protein